MTQVNLDKVPPQNIDAERAVLGAMLMADGGKVAVPKVIDILGDEGKKFYKEAHGKIYTAILNIFEKGEPADLLTVTRELERTGDLEKVGGVPYLDEMIDSCPTAENVEYYAQMIHDTWTRRAIIYNSSKTYNDAFDDSIETPELLDNAEKGIFGIRNSKATESVVSIKSVLKGVFDQVEKLYHRQETILGIETGFPSLDRLLSGFQGGDYGIIAGLPSMGKSALMQNMIQHISVRNHIPSALFTLESPDKKFVLRMLAAEAGINLDNLKTGFIGESQWGPLTMATSRINEAPIWIDGTPGIKVSGIRNRLRRLVLDHGIKIVFVDYVQLMNSDVKTENRTSELTKISGGLAGIAKEFDIPFIVGSQLNRSYAQRTDKRPTLSDLRASGALEQDASWVIGLYRDQYFTKNVYDNSAELIMLKNKDGGLKTIMAEFNGPQLRFTELSREVDNRIKEMPF